MATTTMARSTFAALAFCSTTALAASSADWRGKAVYQVLTDRFAKTDGSTTASCDTAARQYCGGTFQGITNQLDYIQGMGFEAVWISPVTTQLEGDTQFGEAYHGYWQQDIESINSHFGTEGELRALSDELHSRNMLLMVDVVTNHFAFNGAPDNVDYSLFNPLNSADDFHLPYCPVDFVNIADRDQLEQCWSGDDIVSLPDVNTIKTQDVWNDWIQRLISDYGIDGLRLDSAISVEPEFWSSFSAAAGVYIVGETYNENVDFVCSFQDVMPAVMDYPAYFPLFDAFTAGGSLGALADTINNVKSSCSDSTVKGTFTENHDRPRVANLNGDITAAKNMIAYTLLADGVPIIYQGQEQHYASLGGSDDPYNREALWLSGFNTEAELYTLISKLNSARKAAINDDSSYLAYQNNPVYSDDTTIAMRKGKMITILSNKGENGDAYEQAIPARLNGSEELTEVLSCETLTADADGGITVPMEGGLPRVYYPSAAVSGLCSGGGSRKRGVQQGFQA